MKNLGVRKVEGSEGLYHPIFDLTREEEDARNAIKEQYQGRTILINDSVRRGFSFWAKILEVVYHNDCDSPTGRSLHFAFTEADNGEEHFIPCSTPAETEIDAMYNRLHDQCEVMFRLGLIMMRRISSRTLKIKLMPDTFNFTRKMAFAHYLEEIMQRAGIANLEMAEALEEEGSRVVITLTEKSN